MMTEENEDRRSKHNMMTGGAKNMIDRVKQKTVTLMKAGEENENGRSSNIWLPFAIDAKGRDKNGESISQCMSVVINDKGGDCWMNCH